MITNKTLNSILDDICLFISEILKPSYFVDLNIFKNLIYVIDTDEESDVIYDYDKIDSYDDDWDQSIY